MVEGDYLSSLKFCKNILPLVSRTFAINISRLKGELQEAVTVGYLFCRIADTIEDAPRVTPEQKKSLFNLFKGALKSHSLCQDFEAQCVLLQGDPNHVLLCSNISKVMVVFGKFPLKTQKIILHWVLEMVIGMDIYVQRDIHGVLIRDEQDFKKYCYYVAGVVGIMLTELFEIYGPIEDPTILNTLRMNCKEYGEGLQIVNILKDIWADAVTEKNYYIPGTLLEKFGSSHGELISSHKRSENVAATSVLFSLAREDLAKGMNYVNALPVKLIEIRLFCLIPLLFAYATLKVLDNERTFLKPKASTKISKFQVYIILFISPLLVRVPFLLKSFVGALYKKSKTSILEKR